MVLIYQPPNAHVRISWILLRNAMAAFEMVLIPTTQCACADFVDFATQRNGGGAVKKIYRNSLKLQLKNSKLPTKL
jgi:hypothetical protein